MVFGAGILVVGERCGRIRGVVIQQCSAFTLDKVILSNRGRNGKVVETEGWPLKGLTVYM